MYLIKIYLKRIYWKICKFIGFSILIRDERSSIHSDQLKLYHTATGKYYLPKYAYQDVIKKEIIKNRVFDKEVFDLGKKFIRPNSSIIDAGANYGQMSIMFSKLYSDLKVYSFEASIFIFEILKKNIALNANNIEVHNCVLSDKKGEEYLRLPNINKYRAYGSVEVEFSKNISETYDKKTLIRRIDDFEFEKKISLLKIDVEGWDLKVLKGSVETIKKNQMAIIFEYAPEYEEKMEYKLDNYINFFRSLDYIFLTSIKNNYLVVPKKMAETNNTIYN